MAGRNIEACIARVMTRGSITQAEASALLEDVAIRAEQMRKSGEADSMVAAAGAAAMGIKTKARKDLIDAIRNADRRASAKARADMEANGSLTGGQSRGGRVVQALFGASSRLSMSDAIGSLLHWTAGAANKDNVESRGQTIYRSLSAAFENQLRKDGTLKAARAMAGTPLEREVYEQLWRRSGGTPDARITVSRVAQQIADAAYPLTETIRRRTNAEIGYEAIGKAVDYVSHTNWDPRQLRLAAGPGATHDAAFEAWRAKEEPRAAPETFKDIVPEEGESDEDARTRFLRSWFDATSSGVHMRQSGMAGMAADDTGFVPRAFEGSRNVARSVSQPRIWHWNSSSDWADHMAEFGGGDGFMAQFDRTISAGSRRIALMHMLGTNPAGSFNMLIQAEREQHRTDHEGLARFDAQIPRIKNVMGRLDGTLNAPANADWAERFETVMSLEATSHIGPAALLHLTMSPATVSSELAHHGVSRWDALRDLASAVIRPRGVVDQDALADAGAYFHNWANQRTRDAGMWGHGIPGFVSYWNAQFWHVTPLPTILDRVQGRGVKQVLMSRLGRQIGLPFAEVEEHMRTVLGSYGIGPAEWELIRGAPEPRMVNGQRWVTPHDGMTADPEAVEALLRTQGRIPNQTVDELVAAGAPAERIEALRQRIAAAVEQKQWDMSDRLGMYLNDAADHSTVSPGVRERAMTLGASQPGSLNYMLRRSLMQLKMWPLAQLHQIIGRDIAMSLSGKEMASNIGLFFAMATAGGIAEQIIADAATGNSQRDYKNPVTLLQAFAKGGGLGLYADFLFGEVNRLGGGGIAGKLGPIGSDADKLLVMYNDAMVNLKTRPDHVLQHLWPDLAHFAVAHVPFANLIYLKGSLDYMLWYHLFETAKPGWWERTNRRMARERGRGMAGYQPGAGVPWGVPGVYTATRSGSAGLFGAGQTLH